MIKILLIEDDMEDIFLFNQYLKKLKIHEVELITIQDIQEELDVANFDTEIVFLDYFLDKVKGTDVLIYLRAIGITVPIIIMSDRTLDSNELEHIKELGASDYLPKENFNQQALSSILENLSTNGTYLPIEDIFTKPEIQQITFIHKDGRVIQSCIPNVETRQFINIEETSQPLFGASMQILNNLIMETSGSKTPFEIMKSKDLTITHIQGNYIDGYLISKTTSIDMKTEFEKSLRNIENKHQTILKQWNGNTNNLDFGKYIQALIRFIA